MFSPTGRGRALDLCLAVLMLAGTACGAGMPAAPVSLPGPVAAPSEPSRCAGRRAKATDPPKAPKPASPSEAVPGPEGRARQPPHRAPSSSG